MTTLSNLVEPRSLAELLGGFDEAPASYVRVARELERGEGCRQGLRDLRVGLLSSFTIDLLSPYLVVEGARRGVAVRPNIGPFGQLEQQLLDADSSVYRADPHVVVLAVRVEDVAPSLAHAFLSLSRQTIEREVGDLAARIEALIHAVRERSNAAVLVWNQVQPGRLAAGMADASLELSQTDVIADLNRRIARLCRTVPSAWVFDACRVASEVGIARWHDSKLAFMARAPLSASAHIATAKRLARTLRALVVTPCKCLVLDLDNTLWGGMLGEDGADGVALGSEYPGNVYMDFQRHVLSYRDRGVLLAIASKNNESDVVELFERRSDSVLRLDDFAARQIHWNDKAASIAAIAAELHIGTEAIAFFDDSPAERAWVQARMPEVHVIDVPPDPLRYVSAIEESGAFDALTVTPEDRVRAHQHEDEMRRRTLAGSAVSVADFLRQLEMRVHIATIDAATLPRVAQLIAKTNQFNLTTRRHPQAEVHQMIAEGAIALTLRVQDRFGDSGLVGVALACQHAADAFILDTFLLSCRVIGRKAETALLSAVAKRARQRGAAWLYGEFIPTKKNAPVAGFLQEHGFQPIGEEGRWRLDLSGDECTTEHLYEVMDYSWT